MTDYTPTTERGKTIKLLLQLGLYHVTAAKIADAMLGAGTDKEIHEEFAGG